MMGLYKRVYSFFIKTSIIRLILIAVLIVLLKDYLVNLLLITESTGTEELESLKDNPVLFFLIAIIIGPIVETIIYQAVPINLIQFLLRKVRLVIPLLPILVSAIIFGISHNYNTTYLINAFISGIIYAWYYTVVQSRKESAMVVVFAIHSLKNLFVFIYDFLL